MKYQRLSTNVISKSYEETAQELIRNNPIIDGHNDLAWALRSDKATSLNISVNKYDTDLAKIAKGGLTGQFWSGYIPCDRNLNKKHDYLLQTLEQIDLIKRMIDQNPRLQYIQTADEFLQSFKTGKVGSMIGLEGGHHIDDSMAALRMFYDLGARYMTLTHSCHTNWADSCSQEPLHNGLTDFGKQIVKEMNRYAKLSYRFVIAMLMY